MQRKQGKVLFRYEKLDVKSLEMKAKLGMDQGNAECDKRTRSPLQSRFKEKS